MNNITISFYLKAIADGGQSKVLIDTATWLAEKGYKIIFYSGMVENDAYIKTASQHINFVQLGSQNHFKCFLRLRENLKKHKPNILISGGSLNNCIATLASSFTIIKVIVTEHISISSLMESIGWKNKLITPFLVKLIYPFSSAVVAVSQGVKNELINVTGVNHSRIKVIYNPVVSDLLFDKCKEHIEHKWLNGENIIFLGVGRLHKQKDFISLINAFSLIAASNNYKLIILGEGKDRPLLQKHIDTLNLSGQVDLVGRVDNPYSYMKQVDVFVLSSLFEGLPTVLIESLACGIPIVSTDCPHGANEILENGKWGKLVPVSNPEALAAAMLEALNEPRDKGITRAMDFSFEKSVQSYENLIKKLFSK